MHKLNLELKNTKVTIETSKPELIKAVYDLVTSFEPDFETKESFLDRLIKKGPQTHITVKGEEIVPMVDEKIKGLLELYPPNPTSVDLEKASIVQAKIDKKEKSKTVDEIKRKPLYTESEIEKLNENYHDTGEKYNAYGKKVKCRYSCPNCKNHGTHYIIDGKTEEVTCHTCKTNMQVKSVKEMTGFKKDKNKNWYVAGDVLPSV